MMPGGARAGPLRQVIDIEIGTESSSAAGAITVAPFRLFSTVRADITPLGGQESNQVGEFMAISTHQIVIRYLPGLLPKMRINFRTEQQRKSNTPVGRIFN